MRRIRDEREQEALWKSETVARIVRTREAEFKMTHGDEAIHTYTKDLIRRDWYDMAKQYA